MIRSLFFVVGGCLAVAACNSAPPQRSMRSAAIRSLAQDDRVVTLEPDGKIHDYSNDEITSNEYDNIALFGQVAVLRPMVRDALADNRVTVAEYNAIYMANQRLAWAEDEVAFRSKVAKIKASTN